MVAGMVIGWRYHREQSPVNLTQTTPIAPLTGEFEALVVPAASPFKTVADFVPL